jgi:hypothetical protein
MNAHRIAYVFLAATLATGAGCDDNKPNSSGSGGSGATGTGGAGSGGSGAPGTGGAGGAGGATTDWTMCTSPAKEGVPVEEFCARYLEVCGFAAGDNSFADMAACTARYGGYVSISRVASQRGCAAYHLCVAGMPGMADMHCPHPAQAGGPCNLPARN